MSQEIVHDEPEEIIENEEMPEQEDYSAIGHDLGKTISEKYEELAENKKKKEYTDKVQRLVSDGYTLQEARDKVDFDETYAGVLDKLNEEVFGEEDDVELPTVQITPEPEEVVNLYSRTEERVLTRDGSIWDGTQNTTVGTVTYNGDKREVHPLEVSPIMNSSYEIIGLLQPGDSFNALGWVKHVKYKNDKRYWVDTFGHRIPVHATSEKPV